MEVIATLECQYLIVKCADGNGEEFYCIARDQMGERKWLRKVNHRGDTYGYGSWQSNAWADSTLKAERFQKISTAEQEISGIHKDMQLQHEERHRTARRKMLTILEELPVDMTGEKPVTRTRITLKQTGTATP